MRLFELVQKCVDLALVVFFAFVLIYMGMGWLVGSALLIGVCVNVSAYVLFVDQKRVT
jgi:hypothetical protein